MLVTSSSATSLSCSLFIFNCLHFWIVGAPLKEKFKLKVTLKHFRISKDKTVSVVTYLWCQYLPAPFSGHQSWTLKIWSYWRVFCSCASHHTEQCSALVLQLLCFQAEWQTQAGKEDKAQHAAVQVLYTFLSPKTFQTGSVKYKWQHQH